jgi:hypothetical protein
MTRIVQLLTLPLFFACTAATLRSKRVNCESSDAGEDSEKVCALGNYRKVVTISRTHTHDAHFVHIITLQMCNEILELKSERPCVCVCC